MKIRISLSEDNKCTCTTTDQQKRCLKDCPNKLASSKSASVLVPATTRVSGWSNYIGIRGRG